MTVGEKTHGAAVPAKEHPHPRHGVPIFEPLPGGPAERFARRFDSRHPALVFFLALLAGFTVLAVLSILLAVLVVHVLVPASGLGLEGTDESFNDTLAQHRTGTLTTLAEVGTEAGGAPVLPIIVAIVAIVCVFLRRWLIAAFAVFALAVESATYRITSLAVPRDRPSVQRLENLEFDASYPSGHTAASIAVYSGLVLLLATRFTSSLKKALAWTAAILLTTFVAFSRMYEGMHHPLDVAGGILVGIGAILVALFACRAAGAAAERRSGR
ncbi:MAG TPA: phosphatase PAP2 family protein [Solirubrobacterales bacterium]|nr:phosphatase PAP2 family protein [Solirubrobacterales bacterium]